MTLCNFPTASLVEYIENIACDKLCVMLSMEKQPNGHVDCSNFKKPHKCQYWETRNTNQRQSQKTYEQSSLAHTSRVIMSRM